jgi:hypothetical protein
VLKYNRWGWLVYMRDPDYVPPLAQAAPARLAPLPSQVAAALPASWAYPNTARAAPEPQAMSEGRGHVALVFMPGVAAFPTYTRVGRAKAEGQIALEFRGTEGGARVRLAAEYTSFGKIGELSFKYDLLDGFFLRPFLAVGAGVASDQSRPGAPRRGGEIVHDPAKRDATRSRAGRSTVSRLTSPPAVRPAIRPPVESSRPSMAACPRP